jgi:hypothetical protein
MASKTNCSNSPSERDVMAAPIVGIVYINVGNVVIDAYFTGSGWMGFQIDD